MRSKYEIRAHKKLVKDGWVVDYKIRPRFVPKGYNVDYFNLFDLFAWKDGDIKLISIKPKDVPVIHKQEIAGFTVPDGISKELWRYDRDPKDRRKIRRRVLKIGNE